MCAQPEAIKRQLYTARDAWFTEVYLRLVTSTQPDDDGQVGEMPETLLEISQNFDLLMDWLSAFHILKPITDSAHVELTVSRLKQARAEVNEDVLCTESVHACNCRDAVHYSWCSHAMAYCLMTKIIKRYPRHIDPTPTASGRKRGRIAGAKPGGARHKGAAGLGAKRKPRKGRGRGGGSSSGPGSRGRGRGRAKRRDHQSESEDEEDLSNGEDEEE